MDGLQRIEEILKKYKYNKVRVVFLENQMKRLTPEAYDDYIVSRAYKQGIPESAPIFVKEKDEEVALLNKVEETACEYKAKCRSDYLNARKETLNEIMQLNYLVSMVEDGLDLLESINLKYKIVIEKYYINNSRMEDIADHMHISRSRCYELCKEAILWMTRLVYGENTAV